MPKLYERRGGEFLANTRTTGDQRAPVITALPSGGFVLTWSDRFSFGDSEVRAQLFDAIGNKVGGEMSVATLTAGLQLEPYVAVLASGGFVISWTSAGGDQFGQGIRAQIFDAAGGKVGGEFLVNTQTLNNQTQSAVTGLASGGFVATWTDGSQLEDQSQVAIKGQMFDAAGNKVGGELLVNTSTAGAQRDSAVTALASGGFVVTWEDEFKKIGAQIYDAGGNRVGGEITVNEGPGLRGLGEPSVTALADGGFVITYKEAGIRAQLFDATGNKVGSNFLVNTAPLKDYTHPTVAALPEGGFIVTWNEVATSAGGRVSNIRAQVFDANGNKDGSEALIGSGGIDARVPPAVTVLASGDIVLAWTLKSSNEFAPDNGEIAVQVLTPTDGPSDIALSTGSISETAVENLPAAFLSTNGAVNSAFSYTLLSDSSFGGFRIEGDRLVVADTDRLDFETAPEVSLLVRATDENGNSFDESLTLAIRDEADESRLVAGPEQVLNTAVAGDQANPALTPLSDGGFALIFTDSTTGEIKARILDAGGNPVGSDLDATERGEFDFVHEEPSITGLVSGGFVVSWIDFRYVRAQIFDKNGAPVGGTIEVTFGTTLNIQPYTALAALPSGGFVLIWDAEENQFGTGRENVLGQIFDGAGQRVGEVFRVNTAIMGYQGDPAVAVLPSGGFVVTYTAGGQPTEIKAQIFNADGAKLGAEFQVNTTLPNAQRQAAIAVLSDGRFVISWTDFSAAADDASGTAVRAQIFDGAGNRIGSEFLVATSLIGDQQRSSIAALPSGGFVIGWQDASGQGGDSIGTSIKAQRFDAAGNRVGDVFLVNSLTSGNQGSPSLAVSSSGSIYAVWTGPDASGSGTDIHGRLLASARGPQDDVITGTPDNDGLAGGPGDDELRGADGADLIDGGEGNDRLFGDGGDDSIFGGSGDDRASGGAGADILFGQEGDDDLGGGDGEDHIDGGSGRDRLNGGTARDYMFGGVEGDILSGGSGGDIMFGEGGEDLLSGDEGDDYVDGGSERDVLNGGRGADDLRGGTGNDTILGGEDNDLLLGEEGDDDLRGGAGFDRLGGGAGRDNLLGDAGGDFLEGGADTDVLRGGDGEDILSGGDGDDFLDGGNDRDVLSAAGGRDHLVGGAGNDTLLGGIEGDLMFGDGGEDELRGSDGDDFLSGSLGRDALFGEVGQDTLYGGAEADVLFGGDGDDFAFGDDGDDYLAGERGRDVLFGGAGRDTIYGGVEADALVGGAGGDLLFGEDSDDALEGGAGDDYLDGGAGNDRLIGNVGADTLVGGAGADRFVLDFALESTFGVGADYLADFNAAEGDRIDLSTIDANDLTAENDAFAFVGTAAFSNKAGELRYEVIDGRAHVFGDTNGDGTADLVFVVNRDVIQPQDLIP